MSTIETMIAEYEQIKKERDAALQELEVFRNKMEALARQLGVDIGRLLRMTVIQSEMQYQAWSNKQVLVVALEDEITEK